MKYILNYCLPRLDAIGNEQILVHHTLNEAATEDLVQNDTVINTNDTIELTNTVASREVVGGWGRGCAPRGNHEKPKTTTTKTQRKSCENTTS